MKILVGAQNCKKNRRFGHFGWAFLLLIVLHSHMAVAAQQPTQWLAKTKIPDFHPETDSPVMLADQNRTIHAFSSQWLGEDEGELVRAIMYNQWTLDNGWTSPIDILISPINNDARLIDAFLDQAGKMHVIFFAGDNTQANIYYAQAPAVAAGQAWVWSKPILIDQAFGTETGAIASDDKGNMVVVYGGIQEGNGLYSTFSSDGGNTWADPVTVFLTYDDKLFPYGVQKFIDHSGWLHVVWNINNVEGQGRGVNYAKLKLGEQQWSEPEEIATAGSGLGTQSPALIGHRGNLFVMYYHGYTGKQYIRRSINEGTTWTDPVDPFRHVGANGPGSFVMDSNGDLHLFWGQRISGSPDIHGMWHSIWRTGDRWSEPEAIVSGPLRPDFDPAGARAAISQGNVILLTWKTDTGGYKEFAGTYYAYTVLDVVELPVVALPTLSIPPSVTPTPTSTAITPTSTPAARRWEASQEQEPAISGESPAEPLIFGIVPVVLLIGGFIVVHQLFHHRH